MVSVNNQVWFDLISGIPHLVHTTKAEVRSAYEDDLKTLRMERNKA
jgi:hypothetical protein